MFNEAKDHTERLADRVEYPQALAEDSTYEELKTLYLESVAETFQLTEELNEVEANKHLMALTLDKHPQALENYYERLGLGNGLAAYKGV